ncbi:hypothetical protein AB0E04_03725 [Streptomyces sp. NPDC048251]|uniref:zinc finger domain-containing protein n=1 Tax=Streptomyces sp. NPDC048251 TaxID=3154501 RepID=UPI003434884F
MSEPLTLEDLINTVICPSCRVAVGVRCVTRAGKPARGPHDRRVEAVEDAAGITQQRNTVRREALAQGKWWSNGIDSKAEEALLAAYAARLAARAVSRPAVTS